MSSQRRSRRWNDDQLRAAIASARSWRSTARALGLRSNSAGVLRGLKARALELGLDSSHFTSQRRWSDPQLRDAVTNASSWSVVLRRLGLTDNAEARVRVKGHAVRVGLDVSHLAPSAIECHTELTDITPDAALLSRASEQFASAWFSVRGAVVAKPDHPAAYDLLVAFGGRYQRIQVKTTTWRAEHGSWTVNVSRRPYVLDKTASRQPYDPDELDQFFIIDGDLSVYLIPSHVIAGRTTINVGAYQAFRVGDASSLLTTSVRSSDNIRTETEPSATPVDT